MFNSPDRLRRNLIPQGNYAERAGISTNLMNVCRLQLDMPLIPRLFAARGPSAVGRLIVAVIVDAIKRIGIGRSLAHVRHEHGKIAPLWTNRNTSASPDRKSLAASIQASRAHGQPRGIGKTWASVSSTVAMPEMLNSNQGSTLTPARQLRATHQVAILDDSFIPALASTAPHAHVMFISTDVLNNSQKSELVQRLHILNYNRRTAQS